MSAAALVPDVARPSQVPLVSEVAPMTTTITGRVWGSCDGQARTTKHAARRWAATGTRASADAHQLVAGRTSPTMVDAVVRDRAANNITAD